MRSLQTVSQIALLAVVIAGSVYGTSTAPTLVNHKTGEEFVATVVTFYDEVVKCHLETPNNQFIEFKPNDNSDDKFQLLRDKDKVKCRVKVRNLDEKDNGLWIISSVATSGITRSHFYQLFVNSPTSTTPTFEGEQAENQESTFTWKRDQRVKEIIGPEGAIYCKVIDPKNFTVFDGFGRCNITLPRATNDHDGVWKMFVGLSGHIVTEETAFRVIVVDGSQKMEVATKVTEDRPHVTLSCNVTSPYPISACKFRSPSGRILLAHPGVGDGTYSFHGDGSSYESGVHTHDCGIRITNPQKRDLGIWRCGIETSDEIYYGFLTVLFPWGMRDPEVAAYVVTEPTLTAERETVTTVEGDSVMSCSVQSAIRYCYFRARNGTIYSVGPDGSSSDMAVYAGAGLDAGECSIRFRSLSVGDGGYWSCHVGFNGRNMPEQLDTFFVNIRPLLNVQRFVKSNEMTIKADVHEGRELDYCRFVRSDGFGFTGENPPERYKTTLDLKKGRCVLWIPNPIFLERSSWTVAVRIKGHRSEISKTLDPVHDRPDDIIVYRSPISIFWILFLFLGIGIIISAVLVSPKKNRRWAYEKASGIRQSFRSSFARKAVKEQNVSENNTANAA